MAQLVLEGMVDGKKDRGRWCEEMGRVWELWDFEAKIGESNYLANFGAQHSTNKYVT